jgi:GH43 family beta-xylosidase
MIRRKKNTFLWIIISLVSLFLLGINFVNGQNPTLRNPITAYGGADPWLTYYEGYYYLATTTWMSDLMIRRSETLAGLKTALPVSIYHEDDPSRCCNMWAPEFHLLEGPNGLRWYYYYSAGTSGTLDNQHTHVLESEGTDPMGPYHYVGRIYDPMNDTWAIDSSILQLDGNLYFLFSAFVGNLQSMFIAPMSNPYTLSGSRVMIAQPTYDWEKVGGNVNEGPVALQHDGQTFIIYSASHCETPDYKLGMLTYVGDDPLRPSSWQKHPEPVFERSDENGVFGVGHNGFFRSPDGTEDWIVYHANYTETGGCTDLRNTRVQRFTWNEDGTPNFGIPVSIEEEIPAPSGDIGEDLQIELSRFRAFAFDSAYLVRADATARIDVLGTEVTPNSQFYVLEGLADPEAVSIMSATLPGYYLRHDGNVLVFAANDGTETFAGDATWWRREGLADSTWISFEAYNAPNNYIGKQFGVLALFTLSESSSTVLREDATFLEER